MVAIANLRFVLADAGLSEVVASIIRESFRDQAGELVGFPMEDERYSRVITTDTDRFSVLWILTTVLKAMPLSMYFERETAKSFCMDWPPKSMDGMYLPRYWFPNGNDVWRPFMLRM